MGIGTDPLLDQAFKNLPLPIELNQFFPLNMHQQD